MSERHSKINLRPQHESSGIMKLGGAEVQSEKNRPFLPVNSFLPSVGTLVKPL